MFDFQFEFISSFEKPRFHCTQFTMHSVDLQRHIATLTYLVAFSWAKRCVLVTTVGANRAFGRLSEFDRLLSNFWIFWKLFHHCVLYMCVCFTCGFIRCSLSLLFWPRSSHTALSPHNPPCWIENVSTTLRHTAKSRDVLAARNAGQFWSKKRVFRTQKSRL